MHFRARREVIGYRGLLVCLMTTLASLGTAQIAGAQDTAPEHTDANAPDDTAPESTAPENTAPDDTAPADLRAGPPSPPLEGAETPGPATRMATSSLTLLVGAQVAPSAAAPFQIGLDVVLRAVLAGGLLLQPRLGASVNGTVVGAAWSWALHAGMGVGWLAPVGREAALAVSAGYDLVLLGSFDTWLVVHRLTAELALPVILGGAVLEPYFQLGTQLVGGGADVALGLGVRAGATW